MMDKLTHYRKLVMRFMNEFANLANREPTPGVETLCIFDQERDMYLLLKIGWLQGHRVRGTTLFVRLCDGKIRVEEDLTEDGIATDLVRAGVPKDDIVLAFHPPEVRSMTE